MYIYNYFNKSGFPDDEQQLLKQFCSQNYTFKANCLVIRYQSAIRKDIELINNFVALSLVW